MDFADERIVDVLQIGSHTSRVRKVRTIQLNGDACNRCAIRGIGSWLPNLDLRKVRRGVLRSKVADRESRQDAFQFGRVASNNR